MADEVTRVEHEKVVTLTKMFAYATEYGATRYEARESLQLSEDTPRKAVQAEGIFLGLRVKMSVLTEAKEDGVIPEDQYMDFMNGVHLQLIRGLKLISEVKEDYIDAVDAVRSVEFIRDELIKLGIMPPRKKKLA